MNPDQARQNVGPDLDTNCLTLMVFLKDFLKEFILKKKSRQKKHDKINKYAYVAIQWDKRSKFLLHLPPFFVHASSNGSGETALFMQACLSLAAGLVMQ